MFVCLLSFKSSQFVSNKNTIVGVYATNKVSHLCMALFLFFGLLFIIILFFCLLFDLENAGEL